jgi:hypothetical protein
MGQKGMKLPGATLSCTVHVNERKLRLRNRTEWDKAALFPVQNMSQSQKAAPAQ